MKLRSELKVTGRLTVTHVIGKTGERRIICKDKKNIWSNAMRDAILDAMYIDTTAAQVGFNFIAVSSNVTAPAPTDTLLTGEITTGGLIRVAVGTKTHTVGTNNVVFDHTFTATAGHTAVQKVATFDTVTVGIIGHINTFAPVNLSNTDELIISWTFTVDD